MADNETPTPHLLLNIISNDIYLLGAQLAILYQFAHPVIAKGSFAHSTFATRIPQRFRNTNRFIKAAAFGTPDEKTALFSVINKYHSRVKGEGYDANDLHAQKWTAATFFVSLLTVHETFIARMGEGDKERLMRECAVFGTSLRMPLDMWPDTLDDFWGYWEGNIHTLEIGDEARDLARKILYPSDLPLGFAVAAPVLRMLTVHWLSPRLAREFGLERPTGVIEGVKLRAVVAGIWGVYLVAPVSMRGVAHGYYMEDMRKAVERITETGHWGA